MAKKAENIFIMDKINCDGVLIECGFLSNYQEEALLRNPEYQKKVSAVIASAVSVYLCDSPLPA
jgi:N-acetylmuramoyl-L-alanine amidase